VATARHPLRIAFVHYRDAAEVGGSLRVEEAIVGALDRHLFEPHLVFAYGGPGPLAASTGAECHWLHAAGHGDPAAWLRARALVRRLKPDLIHYMEPVVWIRAALLGCGIPSLIHVHGVIEESSVPLRMRLLWRALAHLCTGHVCITEQLRDIVLRLRWAAPARTWVVYNAIDVRRYSALPPRVHARAGLGLPADAFVLGMVCRLVPWKGCLDGIELLARLPQRFHLLICGDGPQRPSLEQAARRAGVADRVRLAGALPDPRAAYAAMDAYLFLSRIEAFGLVLAEAMAAGVPVVGVAGEGGYREPQRPLLTPKNSFLIEGPARREPNAPLPPETAAALAALIERAAGDPGAIRQRAEAGRLWVTRHFDTPRQAEEISRLYLALLGLEAPVEQVCAAP